MKNFIKKHYPNIGGGILVALALTFVIWILTIAFKSPKDRPLTDAVIVNKTRAIGSNGYWGYSVLVHTANDKYYTAYGPNIYYNSPDSGTVVRVRVSGWGDIDYIREK